MKTYTVEVPDVRGFRERAGGFAPSLSIGTNSDEVETPYARRARAALSHNISLSANSAPERAFFFTLTVGGYEDGKWVGVSDIGEANRRFNNLNRRLSEFLPFVRAIKVPERHKNGDIHFHLYIELCEDLAPNWDHESYVRARKSFGNMRRARFGALGRANPKLSKVWKILRKRLHGLGFGRHELVPVAKPEAAGNYLGKYLAKSKGAGSTRYIGDWRSQEMRVRIGGMTPRDWSWNTLGGAIHRKLVGGLCRSLGISSECDFIEMLGICIGKDWCFKLWKSWAAFQFYGDAQLAADWILQDSNYITVSKVLQDAMWECQAMIEDPSIAGFSAR